MSDYSVVISETNNQLDIEASTFNSLNFNTVNNTIETILSQTINLGESSSTIIGLSAISGTSSVSPTILYNCVIDGGSP